MERISARKFAVQEIDFPVRIKVFVREMRVCRCSLAETQYMKMGRVAGGLPVPIDQDPSDRQDVYVVELPRQINPPVDVVQVLHLWFDDDTNSRSAYEIEITSARGDVETLEVGRPTINPEITILTFRASEVV